MTEKREEYVKLLRQGVSNSEACRQLGIDRKTGTGGRTEAWSHATVSTGSSSPSSTVRLPPWSPGEL